MFESASAPSDNSLVQGETQRLSSIPFAVQCQTCGSRLKVSDAALIGTIAACPKCNSMVEITAESNPDGQQVLVGTASVDSQAITEDAIDVGQDVEADPAQLPSGFTASDSIPPQESGAISSPPPAWQSERTARSRQLGLIVAIALSSLIAAVLVFGWFVRNWQQETARNDPLADSAIVSSETDDSGKPDRSPAIGEPELADPTEPLRTEPDSAAAKNEPAAEPAEQPAPAETSGDAIEVASQTPDVASAIESIPSDLLPQSPLDPLAPQDDGKADNEDASQLDMLPEGLQAFIPLLDAGIQQQAELDAPPAIDVQLDAAAEEDLDPMLVAAPPEPINMHRALAIEFALSAEGGRYPLADLMLVISQITGVPIQIDWVTFDLVGIGIGDEVPIKQGWNSAEDFLNAAAESVGGQIERTEWMLTLTADEATKTERLGDVLDLADFGDGRESAAQVLNQYLPWGDVGAALKQDRDGQNLAALAVEALRRIRGVSPKVPDVRFFRSAQSTSDQPASDQLDWPLVEGGDAGPQYDAPVTMAGLLRRTARLNKATCFVNWYDANRRRMSPAQLTMPFTSLPAGTVIAKELQPFALQARQVDTKHWWVGSQANYDRFPMVVWTEPLGAQQVILAKRLKAAVTATNADVFSMAVDPETDRALLLLPRYLVRQLPTIQNGLDLTKAP